MNIEERKKIIKEQIEAVIAARRLEYEARGKSEREANSIEMLIIYRLTNGLATDIQRIPKTWTVPDGFTSIPDDGGSIKQERFSQPEAYAEKVKSSEPIDILQILKAKGLITDDDIKGKKK